MKKILLVLGLAAFMAACSGNKPKNEPAQEEGTEMQMEGTEDQQQDVTPPADTTSVETPSETTPPPAQ
jgi:PBP1b-binding outer membrane lipoprotein LpoB